MKITMITTIYGKHAIGGAERSTALLCKRLVDAGHEVSIISLGAKGSQLTTFTDHHRIENWETPLIQWYDPYHNKIFHKRNKFKKLAWHALDIFNPFMAKSVGKILDKIKPEIVLTHTLQGFSTAVWTVMKKKKIPFIHMSHDHALICPSTAMTKGTKSCEKVCTECSIFNFLRRSVSIDPDAVVAPSEIILKRHENYHWFRNIAIQKVIPNAISENWPNECKPLFQSEQLTFGFIGRMDESKGIDIVLNACLQLPPQSYSLKVAGPGHLKDFEPMLNQLHKAGHKIEVYGVVDAQEFFQQIDILICPSRAVETFSNVVMEASCSGRPSIVSDRGALPERVEHGKTGWIFESGNSNQLAKIMLNCLEHRETVLEKAALAWKQRKFYSADQNTLSFLQLFEDVIQNLHR